MDRIEASRIIIKPVLTEKANTMRESNTYVFRVERCANKNAVKKALEVLFGVDVKKCNIMNMRGKKKRLRFKEGITPSWKKAIVTIEAGQSFPFFEGATK